MSGKREEDEDGSDEEDEVEEEKTELCVWSLSPSESTYDDGMLRILTVGDKLKKEGCLSFGCNLVSIVMLLGFNAVLQLTVVTRVYTLVEIADTGKSDSLFAPTGACAQHPNTKYPAFLERAGIEDENWDCGPLFPMIMSNITWLDVNNDGFWSGADQLVETGEKFMKMFGKTGNLTRTFEEFMKDARALKFRFQKEHNLDIYASGIATLAFTMIPMSWMRTEQPVIDLCNNVDPNLCGNLEIRGVLKKKFPDNQLTGEDRVDECRDVYGRCLHKFGELYRSYTLTAEQTCGGMTSAWDIDAQVIVNRYDNADKYDPHSNKQAITTSVYEIFLLLVLIIWWLIVIAEVRQVLTWWMVMTFIPAGRTEVKRDDESISVESISGLHKCCIFAFVLIPRTVIIIGLSYIGTQFLIGADSYSDLILNSVALGFLIEVDDMLFAAVTSQKTKENMDKMQPLQGKHSCLGCCITVGSFPTSIPLVVFVVGMSFAQMSKSFFMPGGKYDLSSAYACLCHLEGSHCTSAQIMEGAFRIT